MDIAITRMGYFWALAGALAIGISGCGGGGSTPNVPDYQIGGSVTGLLTGNSVVLLNDDGNRTPVSVNASFRFSTPLSSGANYAVTISAQPEGESCTITNATGRVANANVKASQ
jgi:hypothetical protein